MLSSTALEKRSVGKPADRMEELRGKASGLYVLQTANINKNIEDMSEQELEEKMKKIVTSI